MLTNQLDVSLRILSYRISGNVHFEVLPSYRQKMLTGRKLPRFDEVENASRNEHLVLNNKLLIDSSMFRVMKTMNVMSYAFIIYIE